MTLRVPIPVLGTDPGAWDELTLLAATVFGEARGEPWDGQVAVAHVVLERALRGGWFGQGIAGVVLRDTTGDGVPDQFSCFRPVARGGQLEVLVAPLSHEREEVWIGCFHAAVAARFGYERSKVQGATHYLRVPLPSVQSWTSRLVLMGLLGQHAFFREPDPRTDV